MESSDLALQPSINKYIRSLYFASTTMLTIGYGDITPKSPTETIVNICIQIVGVISFGYLLNEMGHTLSKMRERSEDLERDLQTITKISKYYSLEKGLRNKAKTFIFNNTTSTDDLKMQDEQQLLNKLDDGLRDGTPCPTQKSTTTTHSQSSSHASSSSVTGPNTSSLNSHGN